MSLINTLNDRKKKRKINRFFLFLHSGYPIHSDDYQRIIKKWATSVNIQHYSFFYLSTQNPAKV
jgi:hypothetical protein